MVNNQHQITAATSCENTYLNNTAGFAGSGTKPTVSSVVAGWWLPVGLELPILVLIPGLSNVAWHPASALR